MFWFGYKDKKIKELKKDLAFVEKDYKDLDNELDEVHDKLDDIRDTLNDLRWDIKDLISTLEISAQPTYTKQEVIKLLDNL